jgi:hypothetical protein
LPGGKVRAPPQLVSVDDLPTGWSAAHIPPNGATYYFNKSGDTRWTHPSQTPAELLASGGPVWRPVLHDATGAVYWWHVGDGRVQWSLPVDVDIPGLGALQSMMAVRPSQPPLPPTSSAPMAGGVPASTMGASDNAGAVSATAGRSLSQPARHPSGLQGPPLPPPPTKKGGGGGPLASMPMPAPPRPQGGVRSGTTSRWGPDTALAESLPKKPRPGDPPPSSNA